MIALPKQLIATDIGRQEISLKEERNVTIKGEQFSFTVTDNPSDYEPVRDRIRSEINKRFDGWSNEHDRQFDGSAFFFLLSDKVGQLRAAIRIIVSEPGSCMVPASHTDGACEFDFEGAAEYSGLWFDEYLHCRALAALSSQWVDQHFGNRKIYAIFESSNRIIRRIYLNVFGFQSVDHPPITYNGFCYRDSGETVEWELTTCPASTRKHRAMNLLKYVGVETGV